VALNLVSDWRFCYELTHFFLAAPQPVFLSRVGGSDTTAIVDYLHTKTGNTGRTLQDVHATHLPIVEKFNGYYDKGKSIDKFFNYCELLSRLYLTSDNLFFCNNQLLSICFKDNINEAFYVEDFPYKPAYLDFISRLSAGGTTINCYPYNFVENIVSDEWTLFRVFSDVLPGKKVLVISAFSESITQNFHNRHSFFKNYDYPDFSLLVYNTPITYANLPDEFYPDQDWFQTLERMKADIAKLDFDVALLSCGSYGLALGDYIQRQLKRNAVYIGGVLQLYFGIMGRRYENPFFTSQINMDSFIYPVERDKFLKHVAITAQTPREAFGAYF